MNAPRACSPAHPCERTNPVHLLAYGFCWSIERQTVPHALIETTLVGEPSERSGERQNPQGEDS